MRVDVLISGFLGGHFVQERLEIELAEGATLQQLLAEVKRRAGLDLTRLNGTALTSMLSGRRLELASDLQVQVADGDLLTVLSPLGGG